MGSGQTTLTGLVREVESEDSVFFRMVLYKSDVNVDLWRLHSLLIDARPDAPVQPFVYDYGDVIALAGQVAGVTVGAWLTEGHGKANVKRLMPNDSFYTFDMPPIVQAGGQIVQKWMSDSHTSYGGLPSAPWPYTQYEVPLSSQTVQVVDRVFSAEGCRTYQNLSALVSDLVYGLRRPPATFMKHWRRAVTVCIAQTDAWIDSVTISPATLSVTVKGRNILGTRLQVTESPDVELEDRIAQFTASTTIGMQEGVVDFPMPNDRQPDLWIVLTRKYQVLDESYPLAEQHPLGPVRDNVIIESESEGDKEVTSDIPIIPIFGPAAYSVNNQLAFVLMPFKPELTKVYESLIKPTVKDQGLICRRADDYKTNKAIIQDIWKAICEARVVIADLTGFNPNVMYELGIAHTVGKETILIYQSGSDESQRFPFDLAHIRRIQYDNDAVGGSQLQRELAETLAGLLHLPTLS